MDWLFPVFILSVWMLWAMAGITRIAAEDAERGIPEPERRGVSLLPGIPLFPLAAWGLAWAIDRVAPPWGYLGVGSAHTLLAVAMLVSITRDQRRIRAAERST